MSMRFGPALLMLAFAAVTLAAPAGESQDRPGWQHKLHAWFCNHRPQSRWCHPHSSDSPPPAPPDLLGCALDGGWCTWNGDCCDAEEAQGKSLCCDGHWNENDEPHSGKCAFGPRGKDPGPASSNRDYCTCIAEDVHGCTRNSDCCAIGERDTNSSLCCLKVDDDVDNDTDSVCAVGDRTQGGAGHCVCAQENQPCARNSDCCDAEQAGGESLCCQKDGDSDWRGKCIVGPRGVGSPYGRLRPLATGGHGPYCGG